MSDPEAHEDDYLPALEDDSLWWEDAHEVKFE